MATFSVDIKGLDGLLKDVRAFGKRGNTEIKRWVKTEGDGMHHAWVRNVKPHRQTGKTQESIHHWFHESQFKSVIFGTSKILAFLEFGTKPHIIKPKSAGGILAFFWKRIGAWAFRKQTFHPGTKAYTPLLRARISHMGLNGQKSLGRLRKRFDQLKVFK